MTLKIGAYAAGQSTDIGTVSTANWCVYTGTQNTMTRGNLNVPFGSLTVPSLTATSITTAGETDTGNLTVGGTATVSQQLTANAGISTTTVQASGNITGQAITSNGGISTTTVQASGNITGQTITSNRDISGASLTTLGDLHATHLIYTGFINNNGLTYVVTGDGNVACTSLTSGGDVKYNSSPSLINTLNGKANLSGCTFAGNVTVPTLTANNIITSAETDNGNLTGTGTATLNGISNTGTCTTNGDIKYNNNTSLTTQMATLNSYKLSGTLSATTAFQTIYTLSTSCQGIVTACSANSAYMGMCMGFFQWYYNGTNATLTQLAACGNGTPAALQTPNTITGTNNITIQISGLNIQAKSSTSSPIQWYITFL